MSTHNIGFGEVILMSTHNIGFIKKYAKLSLIIEYHQIHTLFLLLSFVSLVVFKILSVNLEHYLTLVSI